MVERIVLQSSLTLGEGAAEGRTIPIIATLLLLLEVGRKHGAY